MGVEKIINNQQARQIEQVKKIQQDHKDRMHELEKVRKEELEEIQNNYDTKIADCRTKREDARRINDKSKEMEATQEEQQAQDDKRKAEIVCHEKSDADQIVLNAELRDNLHAFFQEGDRQLRNALLQHRHLFKVCKVEAFKAICSGREDQEADGTIDFIPLRMQIQREVEADFQQDLAAV